MGIVQLGESVAEFHPGDVDLEALDKRWIVLCGIWTAAKCPLYTVDRGLNQLMLGDVFKQQAGNFAVLHARGSTKARGREGAQAF